MVNIHLLITGYNISSGSYTVRYIIYIGKANHYKQRTAQTHQHYIYIQIQKWVLLTEFFLPSWSWFGGMEMCKELVASGEWGQLNY